MTYGPYADKMWKGDRYHAVAKPAREFGHAKKIFNELNIFELLEYIVIEICKSF